MDLLHFRESIVWFLSTIFLSTMAHSYSRYMNHCHVKTMQNARRSEMRNRCVKARILGLLGMLAFNVY